MKDDAFKASWQRQFTPLLHPRLRQIATLMETADKLGAAKAMRRILVDRARARRSSKRGGRRERVVVDDITVASPARPDELLALHEALTRLAALEPQAAELVHFRYFAGQT